MEYSPILGPVVALVAWTLVMLVWLAIARRRAFAAMGISWGTIPRGSRGANLDGRAPEGGLAVALSTMSELLLVPPAVNIQTGERTATFNATAMPVEVETAVPVTVSAGAVSVSSDVTIVPPQLTDLAVMPGSVIGGESLTATVTINAPAAPEGARVQLSTSDPAIVAAPSQLAVSSGATNETASEL